ncbi:adenylyl cyclase [Xylanimonas oleitrophica]|uniref:Adenylyl cyclase n=1 Tax=Xylanimonas oleitrophica TaxID=2607479 RepID=A0A2W5WUI1_9MICO|nr:adenylyl cyclase [Xylanimonas oleitrophica]PZR54283.1 adenylyl cyclase [Xylanimonas oleitrophica]
MKTIRAFPLGAAVLALVASASLPPAAAAPGPSPATSSDVQRTGPGTLAADPDFGPHVTFIDPSWSTDRINTFLDQVNDEPEFSQNRHQVFFEPGVYGSAAGQADPSTATDIVNASVGYYQAVAGLGAQPGDVLINGALHVEPVVGCPEYPWACGDPGSLTRFWRSMSNLAINPIQRPVGDDAHLPYPAGVTEPHQMRWAVSQAAPMRRVEIRGDLTLFGRYGEFASGGYLANSRVTGTIVSGSQQQWFTRNSEVGAWDGGVWNMVFSGVEGAPATDFGPRADGSTGVTTTLDRTPLSREAPFLYRGGDGNLAVFVPHARRDTRGVDWSTAADAGRSVPIGDFYVARPDRDDAQSINAQLAQGRHLILTPGVYRLDRPLQVDRAGTVVLGLGYASLTPTGGNAALEVGDVTGVKVAGITVDANVPESQVLVRVGPGGAQASDPADPTTLTDVFVRVGGPWEGKAVTSVEVNSDGVLLDHLWLWRADHGDGVAWDRNTGAHGLVVNGDDVTATGLFVEHYQAEQTVWNGERGTTVFYQSELPYDPPSQAAWGGPGGYASYRVADHVGTHRATGLGVYSFFNQGVDVRAASGIRTPAGPGIAFRSMTSVFLNGSGGIEHVVNDVGGPAVGGFASPQVVAYP